MKKILFLLSVLSTMSLSAMDFSSALMSPQADEVLRKIRAKNQVLSRLETEYQRDLATGNQQLIELTEWALDGTRRELDNLTTQYQALLGKSK